METRQIEKLLREIRRSENVLSNTKEILSHISDLRYHAESGKDLEPSVRKALDKDASHWYDELFFAVEAFIKSIDYRIED